MTRDGVLVCRHENEISLTTDVAERFPGSAWIAVELLCGPNDRARLESLRSQLERQHAPRVRRQ